MAKYAIVENGIVENIIEAEEAFVNEHSPEAIEVTSITGVPYIKGTFVDGVFYEPERIRYEVADPESGIPAPSMGN